MLKAIKYTWAKASNALLFGFVTLTVQAQESIPLADGIKDDMEDKELFEWLKDMAGGTVELILYVIGAIVSCVVLYGLISKFVDWRKGREELGEFFNSLLIGILFLLVMWVMLGIIGAALGVDGTASSSTES